MQTHEHQHLGGFKIKENSNRFCLNFAICVFLDLTGHQLMQKCNQR